jgi:hypothetical protein
MEKFPESDVLFVMEGHSSVETGEIIYQPPGRKRDYCALPAQVN